VHCVTTPASLAAEAGCVMCKLPVTGASGMVPSAGALFTPLMAAEVDDRRPLPALYFGHKARVIPKFHARKPSSSCSSCSSHVVLSYMLPYSYTPNTIQAPATICFECIGQQTHHACALMPSMHNVIASSVQDSGWVTMHKPRACGQLNLPGAKAQHPPPQSCPHWSLSETHSDCTSCTLHHHCYHHAQCRQTCGSQLDAGRASAGLDKQIDQYLKPLTPPTAHHLACKCATCETCTCSI
jgi:hypothetical protein